MTSTHPQTLRQALAYLSRRPLVRLTTRFASVICHSHWRFIGLRAGAIWFEPRLSDDKERGGNIDLVVHSGLEECGLTFDEAGFHYHRGKTWVRVAYCELEPNQ